MLLFYIVHLQELKYNWRKQLSIYMTVSAADQGWNLKSAFLV